MNIQTFNAGGINVSVYVADGQLYIDVPDLDCLVVMDESCIKLLVAALQALSK